MKGMLSCLITVLLAGFGCSGGANGAADDGRTNSDSVGTQDSRAPGDVPAPGDATGEGTPGDDAAAAGESWYNLALRLEQGPGITCNASKQVGCLSGKTCCELVFDRDLTGLTTKFSFGSTHIAPAIAFAMSDTMASPFAVVTLNFGILVGTADKPPSTPTSGEYPFTGFEPEVEITIYNKNYTSKSEGSEGTFNITDWSVTQGGLFAGTFAGSIVQETDKVEKLGAEVEGEFHFILPEPQGGQ